MSQDIIDAAKRVCLTELDGLDITKPIARAIFGLANKMFEHGHLIKEECEQTSKDIDYLDVIYIIEQFCKQRCNSCSHDIGHKTDGYNSCNSFWFRKCLDEHKKYWLDLRYNTGERHGTEKLNRRQ